MNYRPIYSDYVRHALRFYTRNLKMTEFRSSVDQKNWLACAKVLSEYPDDIMTMLIEVYSSHDTLADNVYQVSKAHNVQQGLIWDWLKGAEQKIARERGLI